MTCTTLEKLHKDAMVCFDRQVNLYVILISRKYEVLDQACKLLSATLRQTNYHVQTTLDILDSRSILTQREEKIISKTENKSEGNTAGKYLKEKLKTN